MQDSTDRLVVATEEHDVLYVLHWLNEIRANDCLEEAINNKHSWKGYSALESIIQSPSSPFSQIILEMLLLHGADGQSKATLDLAMERKNMEALKIMMNWKTLGKARAIDARHLSSLSLVEAANWIDSNLPPRSDPDKLTGWRTPPARPQSPLNASYSISTVSLSRSPESTAHENQPSNSIFCFQRLRPSFAEYQHTDSQYTQDPRIRPPETYSTPFYPIPVYDPSPSASPKPACSPSFSPPPPNTSACSSTNLSDSTKLFHSPSVCSSPASASPQSPSKTRVESRFTLPPPHPPELVQLHIGNLPLSFPTGQVQSLFDAIGVRCLVKFCRNKDQKAYAFILVEKQQADYCIERIHNSRCQGRRLWCGVMEEEEGHETKEAYIVFDRLPPSRPLPPDARSTQPQYRNDLLIFNLPLNETDSVVRLISTLPNLKLFRLFQQDQSVAFVQADSPIAVDLLINQLSGCQFDGRTLEVVRVESGMFAEQAIRLHLQTLHSRSQLETDLAASLQSYPHFPSPVQGLEPVSRKRTMSLEGMDDRMSKKLAG